MKISRHFFFIILAIILQYACNKESEHNNDNNGYNEHSIINNDYIDIDWSKTEIKECNPTAGLFSFENNSQTQKIIPGSVLSIDVDTMGYIIIVNEVTKGNDKITIKSEKGSLCDIFANYDFTLSSSDNNIKTRTNSKSNVFTPNKIIIDGKVVSYLNSNDTSTRTLTRATTLTSHIWDWESNYNNEVLYQNSNSTIYLKEANMSASLDLNLDLSFGQRSLNKTIKEAYKQYKSKALGIKAVVVGNLSSNLVVQADIKGHTQIQEKEDELWKHNIFKPIRLKFVVQGVPIYLTLSADLYRGANLETEGTISCYTGFRSSADGHVGFEWTQAEGIKPIHSFEMNNEIVYPTVEGKGKIKTKTWLYPRLHLTLYELAGPSFDIKPYLGAEVKGGYMEQMFSESNDYCAWQFRTFAGLDAAAGLSLMFMNYETNHFETGVLNLIERNLYESPTNIQFLSSKNPIVKKGVENQVRFVVYDTNHLLGKEMETPLPQFVKFEADGLLSSKYGIAKSGIVTVDWTPQSDQEKICAVLYDTEGNVIKKAEWGKESENLFCPDRNHPHAIDIGLSNGLKFACCNIDASSPEESGGYYAFCELSEKNEYTMDSYVYENIYHQKDIPESYPSGTKYDVARIKWGKPWRMPTTEDVFDFCLNCKGEEYDYNGVHGHLYTFPNGNKLFFPSAGFKKDTSLHNYGETCAHWAGALALYDKRYPDIHIYNVWGPFWAAGAGVFDSSNHSYWIYGLPVRAVRK